MDFGPFDRRNFLTASGGVFLCTLAGQKLSPVLVAEGDIADGYHRVSLAYCLDPYADVPLKLG